MKTTKLVFFSKPSVIIYRFLYVIKSKNQLVQEFIAFVKQNLYEFLQTYWNQSELQDLIEILREESINDCSERSDQNDCPVIFTNTQPDEAIQDSIVIYFLHKCCRTHYDIGHQTIAFKRLIHLVVINGLINRKFTIRIDPKHIDSFERFRSSNIKQIVLSRCLRPIIEQECLLNYTNQGDLTQYFDQFLYRNITTKGFRR